MNQVFLYVNIGDYAPLKEVLNRRRCPDTVVIIIKKIIAVLGELQKLENLNYGFTLDSVFVNTQLDVKLSPVGIMPGKLPTVDNKSAAQLRQILFSDHCTPSLKNLSSSSMTNSFYYKEMCQFFRVCSLPNPKYRNLAKLAINRINPDFIGVVIKQYYDKVIESYTTEMPEYMVEIISSWTPSSA